MTTREEGREPGSGPLLDLCIVAPLVPRCSGVAVTPGYYVLTITLPSDHWRRLGRTISRQLTLVVDLADPLLRRLVMERVRQRYGPWQRWQGMRWGVRAEARAAMHASA